MHGPINGRIRADLNGWTFEGDQSTRDPWPKRAHRLTDHRVAALRNPEGIPVGGNRCGLRHINRLTIDQVAIANGMIHAGLTDPDQIGS
jgi:hypothetical protein